jgi:hypothetical protein
MITVQLFEKPESKVRKAFLDDIRAGEAKTWEAKDRGKKIVHKSPRAPGWITMEGTGIVNCIVRNPSDPDMEWSILAMFVGLMARRYEDKLHSIQIHFLEK